MNTIQILRSAIFAGIAIGVAGFGYLAIGGIAGAILFSCGLLAVVSYRLRLYTGTAGFIVKGETMQLLLILLGNILGCLLVALLARLSPLPLQDAAQKILEGRLAISPLSAGALAIGCGYLMTTSVTFARKDKFLPLLFSVPMFIICGFPHCVADAFYYMTCPADYLMENAMDILVLYISIVLGNFIGCNLYRILLPKELL